MNTPLTPLERHATELGLIQEDAAPIQRVKPPVATADKVLLGVGCCLLAAGSAAISVWMVVPTLLISSIVAMALVHSVNSFRAASHGAGEYSDAKVSSLAGVRKDAEFQRSSNESLDDVIFDPTYRNLSCNVYHRDSDGD